MDLVVHPGNEGRPDSVNFPARWPETLAIGAVIGIVAVIQTYRKETIRRWADEVAGELAKVTWPTRDIVTNGTIVVVIASFIATAYVGILDRLWSFLTNLVYGA